MGGAFVQSLRRHYNGHGSRQGILANAIANVLWRQAIIHIMSLLPHPSQSLVDLVKIASFRIKFAANPVQI